MDSGWSFVTLPDGSQRFVENEVLHDFMAKHPGTVAEYEVRDLEYEQPLDEEDGVPVLVPDRRMIALATMAGLVIAGKVLYHLLGWWGPLPAAILLGLLIRRFLRYGREAAAEDRAGDDGTEV